MDYDKIADIFNSAVNEINQEKLIKDVCSGKKTTIEDLCNKYKATPQAIRSALDKFKKEGYDVVVGDIHEEVSMIRTPLDYKYHSPKLWSENPLKLGIVSDTHLGICDEYSALSELTDCLNRFKDSGVSKVLHIGDITHGVNSRHKDLKYEMAPGVVGADEQVKYVIDNYPLIDGIDTYFITGNHDLWVHKDAGFDVGKAISNDRDDLIYLGQEMADLFIGPNDSTRIRMHHPGGGSTVSVSYKPQKFVESMVGGTKPHIYLIGHYHRFCLIRPRNVITMTVPGFMWDSPFYKRIGKEPEVGGILLELNLEDGGGVHSFKSEFIPYYRSTSLPHNNS